MGRYYAFNSIPDRALELADSVGESLRQIVPAHAGKWFEAGAKIGALRGGARMAGLVARRNPTVLATAAVALAGAGLLWYAAHRRARRTELGEERGETLEGTSRRVEARRAQSRGRAGAGTAAGTGAATAAESTGTTH